MQVPEALSKGRAYDSAATESHGRSWTNAQLLHKWEVLPARAEIPIRRVKWVQAMTEHNHAHLQTNGGDLGTASRRGTNIDGRGFFLSSTANSFAVLLSGDLHLFAGLSGTEDFFELWVEKQSSVVSIFDDEDFRDSFQRTVEPRVKMFLPKEASFTTNCVVFISLILMMKNSKLS